MHDKHYTRFIQLLAGAGLALTSMALSAATSGHDIVEKARQEAAKGKFLIMVSSPKGSDEHRALMNAFQKRFDIKVDWEWLPLTSGVSGSRVVEQSKAGIAPPSAIGGYPYSMYESWIVKNNLDEKVDWVGEFSSLFPAIGTAAQEGVASKYQQRLLRQWDVQYVLVYNTQQVSPDELPRGVHGLADPKWAGRFAMSNIDPSPLDVLSLDQGIDQITELTKRLVANSPRYKAGPPAVVGAVAAGEVAVGVSGYTALAEVLKAKGAPIDWVVPDVMPVIPLFDFMLKGAPQPNLGKLFLAWLATEGAQLQEEWAKLSSFSNPDSPTTQAILKMKPDVRALEPKTQEEVQAVEDAMPAIMKVISGAAGK